MRTLDTTLAAPAHPNTPLFERNGTGFAVAFLEDRQEVIAEIYGAIPPLLPVLTARPAFAFDPGFFVFVDTTFLGEGDTVARVHFKHALRPRQLRPLADRVQQFLASERHGPEAFENDDFSPAQFARVLRGLGLSTDFGTIGSRSMIFFGPRVGPLPFVGGFTFFHNNAPCPEDAAKFFSDAAAFFFASAFGPGDFSRGVP